MSRKIITDVKGYLSHKGKKWYAQIALNTVDEDGNTGREMKWVSLNLNYPGNKREAQNKLKKCMMEYEKNLNKTLDRGITIAEFVPYFLEQLRPYIRQATYEGYKLKSKHIIRYFGPRNTLLAELSRKMAREFFNYMLTEGKVVNRATGERGALAKVTVNDIKNLFCQMIDFAVEDELLSSNPIQRMKLNKSVERSNRKDFQYMDFERSQEFIHYLRRKEDPLADLLITCLNFGLRRSEVLGLTYDSLDLEAMHLKIRRTVTRITTIHNEENTKSVSGWREFILSEEEQKFFQKILKKRQENKSFFEASYITSDFLFTWPDGRPYRPDYLTRRAKQILEEFGEPELTLHSLRHSYASILYEKGIDLKEAQYLMGHADSQVTMDIYIHIGRKKRRQGYTDLQL